MSVFVEGDKRFNSDLIELSSYSINSTRRFNLSKLSLSAIETHTSSHFIKSKDFSRLFELGYVRCKSKTSVAGNKIIELQKQL